MLPIFNKFGSFAFKISFKSLVTDERTYTDERTGLEHYASCQSKLAESQKRKKTRFPFVVFFCLPVKMSTSTINFAIGRYSIKYNYNYNCQLKLSIH